ncbi:MAG TPA: cytochrome c peroxidase [Chitinophagales bacterium]|nr:cytochrome c peroxidase [Chitinophagales bacterium]
MTKKHFIFFCLISILYSLIIFSCKKENNYQTTPYLTPKIQGFRDMPLNSNNPMTLEGIALGKKLFFDPILSRDSTLSCAGCHKPIDGFSDVRKLSTGVDGIFGRRNASALVNLAWQKNRFFWDGRESSLTEQALKPVEDPVEMHLPWAIAEFRLQNNSVYKDLFYKAFGVNSITKEYVTKALEQFEMTLVSYNSKFDKYVRGEVPLSISEIRGFDIFKTEKGDCFHCHSSTAPEVFISPDRTFANNGLDSVENVTGFLDFGLGEFTNDLADYGRFKIPSLRNLAFTAPYMHDGRFQTLDEVIDFYSEGPKGSPTLEPIMREKANKRLETLGHWGLDLTPSQKADLKAFLLTLSDSSFVK